MSDTEPLYVCIPLVFIEVVLIVVSPVPVVSAVKGVALPTRLLNSTAALPAIVKDCAPSTVSSNFILEAGAVSVVFFESVTLPLYACVPSVLMPAVFMTVSVFVSVVRVARPFAPNPTSFLNSGLARPEIVREYSFVPALALFTVSSNVTAAAVTV